jgi:hypothetical protein
MVDHAVNSTKYEFVFEFEKLTNVVESIKILKG